jgi:flagellar motor switch protein FliG
MEIDAERVKAFMARIGAMSAEEKQIEYARLAQSDPGFHAQVQALADAVKAHDEAVEALTPEDIADAARSPRVQHLATTLNGVGFGQMEKILVGLGARSPALVEALRAALFTFDDLVYADNRGLQDLLARVDRKVLRYAMRVVSPEVEEKLYSQMSRRAAEQLREDIEVMGKVRRREVHEAQGEISELARKMMKDGLLIVRKPGDTDEWV